MQNVWSVGVTTVDITPPIGIELEGYHRPVPSDSCLDRLRATVLVFASEQNRVVLFSIDNVGMDVRYVNSIRQKTARTLNITSQQVMVCFTHTHSGPVTDGTPQGDRYCAELEDKLIEVAHAASNNLQPCAVAWNTTTASIGVNRRATGPDGQAQLGVNPSGPVDDRLGVLHITSLATNQPLALMIICTAHANILRGDSNAISADFPGWTRALLETNVGCPVVVIIGAAGDCNARWRGSVADLQRMAQSIGDIVLPMVPEMKPEPLTDVWIGSTTIAMELMDLPTPTQAQTLAAKASAEWGIDPTPWFDAIQHATAPLILDLEVQGIRVGDGWFFGIPMEPFAATALTIKQHLNEFVFFGGYTNGWIGYLPTTEEYPRGGYEVDWVPIVYGYLAGYLMPARPDTSKKVVRTVIEMYNQTYAT